MLPGYEYLILDQQARSQNKEILKLLIDFDLGKEKIPFTVTSISNPETVVCSVELTAKSREIVFENVAENHFVKALNPDYSIRYSPIIG
uniref:Uncharacterized protein n=1 Tax=Panagrolaimus sp. JU765 TaxID=591449 RepID=A0AC34Q3D9_9BILA